MAEPHDAIPLPACGSCGSCGQDAATNGHECDACGAIECSVCGRWDPPEDFYQTEGIAVCTECFIEDDIATKERSRAG